MNAHIRENSTQHSDNEIDVDVDVDSDDDADSDHVDTPNRKEKKVVDKRAHHNALERRRRDHIKDSFGRLREVVPTLRGEKASRAQILKKTKESIKNLKDRIQSGRREQDDKLQKVEELRRKMEELQGAGYTGDPNITIENFACPKQPNSNHRGPRTSSTNSNS